MFLRGDVGPTPRAILTNPSHSQDGRLMTDFDSIDRADRQVNVTGQAWRRIDDLPRDPRPRPSPGDPRHNLSILT
jgi:hypothetical protein